MLVLLIQIIEEITFIFDNIDVLTDRLVYHTDSYEVRHAVGQLVILPFPKVELEEVEELIRTRYWRLWSYR